MAFIVQKAFGTQIPAMRGLFTVCAGFIVFAAGMSPDTAFARETDQSETANCADPKHKHAVVRPLTESVPIRKSDKIRVRRILM